MTRFSNTDHNGRCGVQDRSVDVRQPVCVFVGDAFAHLRLARYLPAGLQIAQCGIDEVGLVLDTEPPDFILSHAISAGFDCVELAQVLARLGYRGRYRLICQDLPAPQMICREVRQNCPQLDFGMFDPAEIRHI